MLDETPVVATAREIASTARRKADEPLEDDDFLIQGLTPAEIDALAQKVYDLFLDELRIEQERYGGRGLR